jgi:hypothetical protein
MFNADPTYRQRVEHYTMLRDSESYALEQARGTVKSELVDLDGREPVHATHRLKYSPLMLRSVQIGSQSYHVTLYEKARPFCY